MSQDWSTDVYQLTGKTANSVMTDIENMLDTLRSNFSGSSAPSDLVAGNLWFNTDSGHEGMRVRNSDNAAWLALLMGDANQKIPIYRNDTCEGWDIDTSVTDRVIALKGGSNAYNANGGTNAGTWVQPNHTHTMGNHTHGAGSFTTSAGDGTSQGTVDNSNGFTCEIVNQDLKRVQLPALPISGTSATPSTNTTGGGATASTYRPAAALCTLQYPDLT